LQRVYRHLGGIARHLQYSIFLYQTTKENIEQLSEELKDMIDPDEDDLRIYKTQPIEKILRLGKDEFLDGVLLDD